MPGETTASTSSSTHASKSARKIPIIVVPGIMGTRLADPDNKMTLAWNPLGVPIGISPGRPATDGARLLKSARLVPDEDNTWGYSPWLEVLSRQVTNFSHLITDYYYELCWGLTDNLKKALAPRGIEPVVLACGYDWRQSNKESASYLQKVVAEAQELCPGEKVILVAHSQGGLVSRYYCRNMGGESLVRALFLIGSPSLGAVKPYVNMKRGFSLDDGFSMVAVRQMLAMNQVESRDFARSMPSMYQLMPCPLFCEADSSWLTGFDGSQTGYPYAHDPDACETPTPITDCKDPYAVYRDIYVGMVEHTDNRALYLGYIQEAEDFHRSLTVVVDEEDESRYGAYMPPSTYCIACTDMDTVAIAKLPRYGEITASGGGEHEYLTGWERHLDTIAEVAKHAKGPVSGEGLAAGFDGPRTDVPEIGLTNGLGDGSVNEISCNPPSWLLSRPFQPFSFDAPVISQVDHGDLPNDPKVIAQIVFEISRMPL